MNKKNLLKALDSSSYVSVLVAAVLILIFEFTASLILLKLAIILFGASFLMLIVLCSMKLYYMETEIKEGEELLVDKTKESKAWLIVRLCFAVVLFVLMIVFLCLY